MARQDKTVHGLTRSRREIGRICSPLGLKCLVRVDLEIAGPGRAPGCGPRHGGEVLGELGHRRHRCGCSLFRLLECPVHANLEHADQGRSRGPSPQPGEGLLLRGRGCRHGLHRAWWGKWGKGAASTCQAGQMAGRASPGTCQKDWTRSKGIVPTRLHLLLLPASHLWCGSQTAESRAAAPGRVAQTLMRAQALMAPVQT